MKPALAFRPQARERSISPLTARILAVNLFAVLMLAGGIFYLDEFRNRLIEQRRDEMQTQASLMAGSLSELAALTPETPTLDPTRAADLVTRLAEATQARIQVFLPDGRTVIDSNMLPDRAVIRTQLKPGWRRKVALWLDRMVELVAAAPRLEPYRDLPSRETFRLPEVSAAARGDAASQLRLSEAGTVVVSVAEPIQRVQRVMGVVVLTADTRDITKVVRAERLASFKIFCLVLALTVLVSFFLARTIVRPIRRLARAADRVRQGRARDVIVPRLPKRTDEIGQLARALSDMTQALHLRMDAIEAFAADVSHEIKNPLSSLRSAVETLERVKDPALQKQLLGIIQGDVQRLDRLITDISDASRMDAELSRARFEPVDLGQMISTLIEVQRLNAKQRNVTIAYAGPRPGTAMVMGLETRLGQVARNLIDNAVSFSPEGGSVRVMLTVDDRTVRLMVDDDGPGIPEGTEENIFKRFYSERPSGEDFGQHSGLGLAISKQVVEAHGGHITAANRVQGDAVLGARFTVDLPAASRPGREAGK
ncbi:sensor histidine kinase [Pedomonas mirosovicensis]|uniref:sensor histidine kinase n=1 Tax=Pedomonas mirosovicensis TaxID=2908641 RepID=UPI00216A8A7C|nr:sensor histidine kinase [Pedomonas mirosovicensis]MCH8684276.1 sensor histidine kinase [Pedomonas mirosovicensis]